MLRVQTLFVALVFLSSACLTLSAQDTRSVREPTFPPVCATLSAPLESSPAGPSIANDATIQNKESADETQQINTAIGRCLPGQAVELALGSDDGHNAFLVNPLTFPPSVSLIIDGGVTVYASRTPANYQIVDPVLNPNNAVCGTVSSPKMITGVCQPVLTFLGDPNNNNQAKNGLYGYGVLDGQGQQTMFTNSSTPTSWWALLLQKRAEGGDEANENSPLMVSAGGVGTLLANDFTMYKITIRNPPFHTVSWGGEGLTVWGVRVQAPWDESNTDGFDLHGFNGTLYDTIVANGDDDIAFAAGQSDTKNITVKHFSAYARDGITILGNGTGAHSIHDLLLDDIIITGDLPSVVTTTEGGVTTGAVNGVSQADLTKNYPVSGYAQALPNAVSYVHGLNVKYQSASNQNNITFRNVCIQDVRTPLNIGEDEAPTAETKVDNILFQNVHILAPGAQYQNYDYAKGTSDGPGTGRYVVSLNDYTPTTITPNFTLSNVVFDDLPGNQGTSIGTTYAFNDQITTSRNIYPSTLNNLDTAVPNYIGNNTYLAKTSVSTPSLANRCNRSVPFITGELFASKGEKQETGDTTNLNSVSTTAGSRVSLHAVVQPIMSQTTYVLPSANSVAQNVVAIASPALTNAIRFYDGLNYIGSSSLSANGTLASLEIKHISPGLHIFTAQYPKDSFYATLNFGSVVIYASPGH
jgi:Glycosyl hydrolases family 28